MHEDVEPTDTPLHRSEPDSWMRRHDPRGMDPASAASWAHVVAAATLAAVIALAGQRFLGWLVRRRQR